MSRTRMFQSLIGKYETIANLSVILHCISDQLTLTRTIPDLDIILDVHDLHCGEAGVVRGAGRHGGHPLLGHDGAVVPVGLQQLARVVLHEGGGEARQEGARHLGGGWGGS